MNAEKRAQILREARVPSMLMLVLVLAFWFFAQFTGGVPPALNILLVVVGAWGLLLSYADKALTKKPAPKPRPKPEKKIITAEQVAAKYWCGLGDHIVDRVVWLDETCYGCLDCVTARRDRLLKEFNVEDVPDIYEIVEGVKRPYKAPEPPKPSAWEVKKAEAEKVRKEAKAEETRLRIIEAAAEADARQKARRANRQECFDCGYAPAWFIRGPERYLCAKCAEMVGNGASANLDDAAPITGRTIEVGDVAEGQQLTAQGGGASILVSGDVGRNARLTAQGGNAQIIVQGAVREGARLSAQGGGAKIVITGYVGPNARVTAQGGSCKVMHRGAHPTARITTQGGSSKVVYTSKGSFDALDFSRYQPPGI